jgi:hypothetical protein
LPSYKSCNPENPENPDARSACESDSSGRAARSEAKGGAGADSATPQKKQQPNIGLLLFFVGTRQKNFRWQDLAISTKNARYKNAAYLTTYYFLLISPLQNA